MRPRPAPAHDRPRRFPLADSFSALAVVVPAKNADGTLPHALAALAREGLGGNTVVAVADETDPAVGAAQSLGARVVVAPPGRGPQLMMGAGAAVAAWLLFLHADTALGPGAGAAVRAFVADPSNAERAAYFRLAFDDDSPAARRVATLANWRARTFGLPYGDQGLLIAAPFYRRLGGFHPLPLMEDVDLVRRIGKARLVELDADAITSAARYRKDGYILRPLRNLCCLGLYFLGVPPRLIKRFYA